MREKFPLLSEKEQIVLKDALHYMKMAELKKASRMLGLSDKGKKSLLINMICTYVKTGELIEIPKIPAVSKAKNYTTQQLAPSNSMLYGDYKNDLKTRNFFKKLIGPQFHFTAFGIDWLNERWEQGKPPTYQNFADFWVKETVRRKQEGAKPKDKWMFIRFMQDMTDKNPQALKKDLVHAWKQLQVNKQSEGFRLINKAAKVLKIRFCKKNLKSI